MKTVSRRNSSVLPARPRTQLLNILIVATDVYVWKLLRATSRSSRPAAEAVVRKMITSVINGRRSMARILWLNWSGGGNLPPSLGVARVLTERGHEVAFAGRPEMVPRVKTAGFRAIEITQAYAQVDRYPQGIS